MKPEHQFTLFPFSSLPFTKSFTEKTLLSAGLSIIFYLYGVGGGAQGAKGL